MYLILTAQGDAYLERGELTLDYLRSAEGTVIDIFRLEDGSVFRYHSFGQWSLVPPTFPKVLS